MAESKEKDWRTKPRVRPEKKRHRPLHVKLTEIEEKALDLAVSQSGLTKVDYVRSKLFPERGD